VSLKARGRFNWSCVKWDVIWGAAAQPRGQGRGVAAPGVAGSCPSWVPAPCDRGTAGLVGLPRALQAAPSPAPAQLRVGIGAGRGVHTHPGPAVLPGRCKAA